MRAWCNGSTTVSKTVSPGSSPGVLRHKENVMELILLGIAVIGVVWWFVFPFVAYRFLKRL
jgi:hypothetical protein